MRDIGAHLVVRNVASQRVLNVASKGIQCSAYRSIKKNLLLSRDWLLGILTSPLNVTKTREQRTAAFPGSSLVPEAKEDPLPARVMLSACTLSGL